MRKITFFQKRWPPLFLSVLLCFLGFAEAGRAAPAARSCLSARAASAEERLLVPVGKTIGVKLFSEGILVVGLSESMEGAAPPAAACGLKTGDFIVQVNGTDVTSTEQFQQLVQQTGDENLSLRVRRGERMKTLAATAVKSDGVYRIGAWVRDSMAGIGTMTYYDPESGAFAALGHSINDVDTGLLMPLESGGVMPASVKAVLKGENGAPGELKGEFDLQTNLGVLCDNNACGVFGTLERSGWAEGTAVPTAAAEQVKTGKATILSCVGGDTVREYEIKIKKLYAFGGGNTRNMLVEITDPALLAKTGGIVQGMSGSPILQNGRLVGAVTHVLVDDPTQGYAVFIGNMLQASEISEKKAA